MHKDFVLKKVKEGATEMYDTHGYVSPWRLSRNIHVSAGVIEECLGKLGFVKEGAGNFVLKGDRGKTAAKEPKRLEDINIASLKVFDDIKSSARDFIQDRDEVDYTTFSLNELRSIAKNKGIKVALSNTKGELIKKIKSKLSG